MRKTLLALALGASFTGSVAFADQATLDALTDAGIQLTDEQALMIQEAEGEDLVNAIAALVQAAGDDSALVESIVSTAVAANPTLADSIFTAATVAAPDMTASIASAVLEGQAPAAGVEGGTPPGLQVAGNAAAGTPATNLGLARAAAAPRGPSGGGGSSSPN